MTYVLLKRGNLETHTQGEHHVNMKGEIGVIFLQAKEYQGLPANSQKLEESHGADFSSQISEESNLANTLILDFKLSEPWDNTFLLSKQSNSWYFFMTAVQN